VLWFAFKKGTLIYLQQYEYVKELREECCDSLSKKELWYICNNWTNFLIVYLTVVIRFQKRNFDIFATIILRACFLRETLWFAFKKGTLIYLQQFVVMKAVMIVRCDSLSKKELWYICNNTIRERPRRWSVVIRFQKRNFDIFATIRVKNNDNQRELWFAFKKGTLIYLQLFSGKGKYLSSCDSLSKKELWYICNNLKADWFDQAPVVIRFQKRNFDIFATMTC